MTSIFVADAIEQLRNAGASVRYTDSGLETNTAYKKGFNRVRMFDYVDAIGSLVDKTAIAKEVEYWQNKC